MKIIKIILFFISCQLIATTLYASHAFYVGGGIMESFNHYAFNANNSVTGNSIDINANENKILGNLFVGYGYSQNSFYIGAELGTNFPDRTASIQRQGVTLTSSRFTDTMKVQDYVTGDLLPGYKINSQWLLYGRVGFAYSRLSLTQHDISSGATIFDTSDNKWGLRLGLGVLYRCNQHIGVGLDYIYTTYQENGFLTQSLNTDHTFRPNSNFIGVSFHYLFSTI